LLTKKCQLKGIKVIETEESYTSVASFLDLDEMPTYGEVREGEKVKFSGTRIQRGLYRSGSGKLINADLNASYNILRKAFPNAFAEGIERCVVHPRLVTPTKQKMKGSA
jgi:putative transposase